jgi:hypothetical protein
LVEVRTLVHLEGLDDLAELGFLQLGSEDVEVGSPVAPVLDLIQGTCVVITVDGVLVCNKILDLSCPADDDLLESLHQVLVLGCGVKVREILIGDVEVGHTLGSIADLGDDSHEVVEVGDKLFLHILWPLVFTEQFGCGVIHQTKE